MKTILNINSQLEIIWWMERYIETFYNTLLYKIKILKFYKWENNTNIPLTNIYSFEENRKLFFFSKVKILFIRSKKIARLCNKKNIEFSISHWELSNIFNVFSKFFWNKAKIILIIHNSIDKKTIWLTNLILAKLFYRYSDKVIFISKELENETLSKLYLNNNRINKIYNSFDFKRINILKNIKIKEKRLQKILMNWKINFCTISRLDENKNLEFFIECFFDFFKKNKNIQLFIIWDWEQNNELQKYINKLKLEKNIFLLWFKNNVYKYLNVMNYFLYVSKSEWFWRTLIDSLSCWIPVLTHDYKYWAKEIIRNSNDLSKCKKVEIHENWILTPYMDKEKFLEWINVLIKTKFDKEKINKNIQKYNVENFKKEWNNIINEK